jgi:endonuclease
VGKSIYEKSTKGLLKEMIQDLGLKPGQVFTSSRALQWFEENYPKVKQGTVTAHLRQASTNDRSRLHHPPILDSDDVLFRVASGQFRLYEPGTDPAAIRELIPGDIERQQKRIEAEEDEEADEEEDEDDGERSRHHSSFALEQDLQRYLATNLDVIEDGLRLYEEDGITGLEYPAGGRRRIDILAVAASGDLVVLELKVEKGYDKVVGQILRYMNWVRKHVAEPGQQVRGMIVCRNMTEDLQLACASIPDVELLEYALSITVNRVPQLSLQR